MLLSDNLHRSSRLMSICLSSTSVQTYGIRELCLQRQKSDTLRKSTGSQLSTWLAVVPLNPGALSRALSEPLWSVFSPQPPPTTTPLPPAAPLQHSAQKEKSLSVSVCSSPLHICFCRGKCVCVCVCVADGAVLLEVVRQECPRYADRPVSPICLLDDLAE